MIENLIAGGLFISRRRARHNIFNNIFVTDCPRESCVVFAIEKGRWHYITARIIAGQPGSCWTATLDPGSEFTEYLRETFDDFYVSTMSPITSIAMARFLSDWNNRRMQDNKVISSEKKMYFASRANSYKHASQLLSNAQDSFFAIDFMLPSEW